MPVVIQQLFQFVVGIGEPGRQPRREDKPEKTNRQQQVKQTVLATMSTMSPIDRILNDLKDWNKFKWLGKWLGQGFSNDPRQILDRVFLGDSFCRMFNLEKMLGQHGGFGATFKVSNKATPLKKSALKVIPLQDGLNWTEVNREIAILDRIKRENNNTRHPNLLNFEACFLNDNARCLMLQCEFCEDPHELWDSMYQGVYFNNPNKAKEVVVQLLSGLLFLHDHEIVHRDIKPENILIIGDPAQHSPRVIIIDFGKARRLIGDSLATSNLAQYIEAGDPWKPEEQYKFKRLKVPPNTKCELNTKVTVEYQGSSVLATVVDRYKPIYKPSYLGIQYPWIVVCQFTKLQYYGFNVDIFSLGRIVNYMLRLRPTKPSETCPEPCPKNSDSCLGCAKCYECVKFCPSKNSDDPCYSAANTFVEHCCAKDQTKRWTVLQACHSEWMNGAPIFKTNSSSSSSPAASFIVPDGVGLGTLITFVKTHATNQLSVNSRSNLFGTNLYTDEVNIAFSSEFINARKSFELCLLKYEHGCIEVHVLLKLITDCIESLSNVIIGDQNDQHHEYAQGLLLKALELSIFTWVRQMPTKPKITKEKCWEIFGKAAENRSCSTENFAAIKYCYSALECVAKLESVLNQIDALSETYQTPLVPGLGKVLCTMSHQYSLYRIILFRSDHAMINKEDAEPLVEKVLGQLVSLEEQDNLICNYPKLHARLLKKICVVKNSLWKLKIQIFRDASSLPPPPVLIPPVSLVPPVPSTSSSSAVSSSSYKGTTSTTNGPDFFIEAKAALDDILLQRIVRVSSASSSPDAAQKLEVMVAQRRNDTTQGDIALTHQRHVVQSLKALSELIFEHNTTYQVPKNTDMLKKGLKYIQIAMSYQEKYKGKDIFFKKLEQVESKYKKMLQVGLKKRSRDGGSGGGGSGGSSSGDYGGGERKTKK